MSDLRALAEALHDCGDQHGTPVVAYGQCPVRAEHEEFAADLAAKGVVVSASLPALLDVADALDTINERLQKAWTALGPEMSADDKELVAQSLWFSLEDAERALARLDKP